MHTHVWRAGLSTALLAMALGCHGKKAEEATPQSPAAQEVTKAEPTTESPAEELPEGVWPDGWLIASESEWLPVINDVGQDLSNAHDAFVNEKRDDAAAALAAAAEKIRRDANARSDAQRKQLETAAKTLDGIQSEVKAGGVDPAAFDAALTQAYRADASIAWMYLERDSWTPTFERPSRHFQQALGFLAEGDGLAAADEIRRGAGFFRLAAYSARADDRELLNAQVKKLDALADEAVEGKLKAEDLRNTLKNVDAAYASSYLHVAENAYHHEHREESRRAFREAGARIRSRTHWVGKKMDKAGTTLADDLDKAGDAIADGAKLTRDKIKALMKRAYDAVGGDSTPDHGEPHAG